MLPSAPPREPRSVPATARGQETQETVGNLFGRVEEAAPTARTIRVSSTSFGVRPMTVTIAEDTEIRVGSKHGGFGDLRTGRRVRIVYERRGLVQIARLVEVLDAK
jgi:hypothetical protein